MEGIGGERNINMSREERRAEGSVPVTAQSRRRRFHDDSRAGGESRVPVSPRTRQKLSLGASLASCLLPPSHSATRIRFVEHPTQRIAR